MKSIILTLSLFILISIGAISQTTQRTRVLAGYDPANITKPGYKFYDTIKTLVAVSPLIYDGDSTISLGTVPVIKGGTGKTSYLVGSMIYASSTGVLTEIPIGTNGQQLQIVGGIPTWQDVVSSGGSGWLTTGNVGVSGASTGSFIGTTNLVSMRFRTNNLERMRIDSNGNIVMGGVNSSGYTLTVGGAAAIDAGQNLIRGGNYNLSANGLMLSMSGSTSAANLAQGFYTVNIVPTDVNIGANVSGVTVDGNAMRFPTTTQGFLPPRVTTTQKNLIGGINGYTITNAGSGLPTSGAAFLTISTTGTGSGALAYAVVSGGVVTNVLLGGNLVNGAVAGNIGNGYSGTVTGTYNPGSGTPPLITFSLGPLDGTTVYCLDCTAGNGNVGVLQTYQISSRSWVNHY